MRTNRWMVALMAIVLTVSSGWLSVGRAQDNQAAMEKIVQEAQPQAAQEPAKDKYDPLPVIPGAPEGLHPGRAMV